MYSCHLNWNKLLCCSVTELQYVCVCEEAHMFFSHLTLPHAVQRLGYVVHGCVSIGQSEKRASLC